MRFGLERSYRSVYHPQKMRNKNQTFGSLFLTENCERLTRFPISESYSSARNLSLREKWQAEQVVTNFQTGVLGCILSLTHVKNIC